MTTTRRWGRVVLLMALVAAIDIDARQQSGSFRASADVVLVPVSVMDGTRAVPGLAASDFELRDNGRLQHVTLQPIVALPIDVTLLLDVSASVSGRSMAQFVAEVQRIAATLQPVDRVRLVAFGTRIELMGNWQPGGRALTIGRLEEVGGLTAFYDALAATFLSAPSSDRPHLVFAFTDGGDNLSFTTADRVIAVAKRSDAALYLSVPTLVGGPAAMMAPYLGLPERDRLDDIAEATGGDLYAMPAKQTPTLPELFARALENFRLRYLLSYSPDAVTKGGPHEIVVRVKGRKYTVRARSGYEG